MNFKFWKKKDNPNKKKKSPLREWLDAAVFAIVAATIIRTFFIEAYTIPTSSMENTLLINDYLFVSKVAYGPRVPMTPIAIPLVHNSFMGGKSYSESVQWKYRRMPGFGDVKLNDVIVFNFPNNDTTMLAEPDKDYYDFIRREGRQSVWNRSEVIWRPVDKRENYIKRCVALPGQTIEIKQGVLYVDGQEAQVFNHMKFMYEVQMKAGANLASNFLKENGIEILGQKDSSILLYAEHEAAQKIKALSTVENMKIYSRKAGEPNESVYPHNTQVFDWNEDNFGPLTIPKKGLTIDLNLQNIILYKRCIETYEGNEFKVVGNDVFINGQKTTKYTFNMDYYWAMGDNRPYSLDSRFWGFVPEDHLVGKASFVWFSTHENGISSGIRWNRLFRGIKTLEQ
jgi:signal peptidase I